MTRGERLRICILNGSPHRHGSTMVLAERLVSVVSADAAVETVHLYDEGPAPCRGCGSCGSGVCVLDDSMEAIMKGVLASDCLILASPLHFTSMTAPMLAFISRLQFLWSGGRREESRLRCGALVLAAGSEYEGMFRPSRSVAAAAFNVLGIAFSGVLTASGTDFSPIDERHRSWADASGLAERIRLCLDGS